MYVCMYVSITAFRHEQSDIHNQNKHILNKQAVRQRLPELAGDAPPGDAPLGAKRKLCSTASSEPEGTRTMKCKIEDS